ncbi:hypothetical protein L7F22_046784 [Adiantum nelumboides]|nr:hypothetical protein [Adiantum nelumboides]
MRPILYVYLLLQNQHQGEVEVMGALGTLGVGLSVLFGIFLAVLAGEIYYMLCCRRSSFSKGMSSRSRKVSSVQVAVLEVDAAACSTEMGAGFAREAALVGSFGGYPASARGLHHSEFVSKFFPPSSELDDTCLPQSLLFPIAEETKEEMELQEAGAGTPASKRKLSSCTAASSHGVEADLPWMGAEVTISVTEPSLCASSTSVSFSVTPEVTPFATPPSSPTESETTSSDSSLSSPSRSTATAASRFSAYSWSPASASSSPATAASRFSLHSRSPSSASASPATADSRFSVNSPAVSPAGPPRFAAATPSSSSPGSQRFSVDATSSCVLGDQGPLGALFGRHYNSPSTCSPFRPVACASLVMDFRHALPFGPDE